MTKENMGLLPHELIALLERADQNSPVYWHEYDSERDAVYENAVTGLPFRLQRW